MAEEMRVHISRHPSIFSQIFQHLVYFLFADSTDSIPLEVRENVAEVTFRKHFFPDAQIFLQPKLRTLAKRIRSYLIAFPNDYSTKHCNVDIIKRQ